CRTCSNEVERRLLQTTMHFIRILCVFAILSCASALARLGETADQFAARYGPPQDTAASKISDKNSPLLEEAMHPTYEYEGWRIRAAFLEPNGPCGTNGLLQRLQGWCQPDNSGLRTASHHDCEHTSGDNVETDCVQ